MEDKTILDIQKENIEKQKKLQEDKNLDDYDNFYNIQKLNTSLLNIDSAFRNQNPKNIFTSSVKYLPHNPLTFTENSKEIKINYPNHNFNINDKIIIQNVEGKSMVISGNMFLFQNFDYLILRIENDININFINFGVDLKLEINYIDNNLSDPIYFYGNIPFNSVVGVHTISLPSQIMNNDSTSQNILSFFNTTLSDFDNNTILIKLPFTYFSTENQILEITDFYKITFYDLYGIPTNGINADFPINFTRLQGFQEVISIIDDNNFIIETNFTAIKNGVGGGDKIQIMKVIKTEVGFPNANTYTIQLQKSYNNVVRIELVSTEFPYIDYLIKESGDFKNNKLYWKHLDDGNHIYSIEIPEGNYDGDSLISLILNNMNSIPRITSTINNSVFNFFEIDYNKFTQEIKFISYKTENLPNSLRIDQTPVNNIDFFRLTIFHPNNIVDVNDTITIFNAVNMGVINAININKTHTVYEINKINNSYSVLLGPVSSFNVNLTPANLTITFSANGGGNVRIKTRAKVSFLFNYKDTMGEILGFKNPGQANSITPYNTVVSNFDSYVNDTILNSVGNIDDKAQLLNFTGKYNYYLLYINNYEHVLNNSNLSPAFAKILLSGNPGDILYNTFINFPLEFDIPISTLNEITIKITYPDGSLPDFRNINHSFTLKITELVSFPKNTGLNSRKTNFIESLKRKTNF